MNILTLEHVKKSYGLRVLFDDVTLAVDGGQKMGLIGLNGAGKTTLLKIIAGLAEWDSGDIWVNPKARIHFLPQEPQFKPGHTVLESVLDGDLPVMDLLRRYEDAVQRDDDDAVTALSAEMDEQQAWELESKATIILHQLGIQDLLQCVDELSGGQRKRLGLARALIIPCDLLILDEPTNHLDDKAIMWLEEYLRFSKSALLLSTHDRYFLDRTVSRIFAFNGGGKIRQSEGGYSDYLIRVELEKPKDGQTIAENMSDAASAQTGESDSKKTWKQREKKLKFSYKEQREYETIDEDIAKLEEKIEKLDREMVKNATNSVKLSELMKEKEETETTLEEKMDRWVYLNDLAEQIENQ